jgi:hypothetical protein
MSSTIGRPRFTATVTIGGSNAACCTHDASMPVDSPSAAQVRMLHPLGTSANAAPDSSRDDPLVI